MDYSAYLQSFGIRPSKTRIAVLRFLDENRIHPTVDDIYEHLKTGISRATIYNALNLFVENGAIRAIQIDDNIVRYDFNTNLHAHFQCTKCGKIMDIQIARRPSLILPDNIKVALEDYFIYGLCADCQDFVHGL